jgi:NTE family protein
MAPRAPGPRIGLVLAGGGARGAYEAGFCAAMFELLAAERGAPPRLDVISGTSIGSINACALAAQADDLVAGAALLVDRWTDLVLEEVVKPDRRRVWAMIRALLGHPPRRPGARVRGGGILDPAPLERLLSSGISFARIEDHLREGRLRAVTVTASRLPRMVPTVFVGGEPLRPSGAPYDALPARLAPAHALASAAIPFLFPAVEIDGALFCDGSLRHNVPLSPAIQLGCDALVIVNPCAPCGAGKKGAAAPATSGAREPDEPDEPTYPAPLALMGGVLQALIVDRIEEDLDRLEQVNAVIAAGEARYGAGFLPHTNAALATAGLSPLRPVRTLHVTMREDLGRLAADFVEQDLRRRHSVVGFALRQLAGARTPAEAELLSYLLFDGAFARELVTLGRRDALAQRDRILEFFAAAGTFGEAPASPSPEGRVKARP